MAGRSGTSLLGNDLGCEAGKPYAEYIPQEPAGEPTETEKAMAGDHGRPAGAHDPHKTVPLQVWLAQ